MRTRQILLALFTVILVCQVTSEDLSEFKAVRSHLFAPFNTTVWLNCSAPDPEKIHHESRLKKSENITLGPNWAAVEVLVDDWENSTLYCVYNDAVIPTIVMAYALPSKVTIDMEADLEEGKEYTIECSVYEVAPLEYLTIYVTRGGDVIDNISYEGPHVKDRQIVSRFYTFNASRSDNFKTFSCEAVLQLGSERHTVNSSEITVKTYTLPEAPVITVQKWIEHGTIFTVECLVSNGFPPEDIGLNIYIEDTPLEVIHDVTNEGTVKGTANPKASYSRLGDKTILCESYLFHLARKTMETTVDVTIYELPIVSFALSRNVTDLGENVTATCDVTNKGPNPHVLLITVDGKEERRDLTTVTHTFTASRRTPSLEVTCTAFILENQRISQSSSQTLQVHYPPEFTESSCPSTLSLVERKKPFSCRADGNPEPAVECGAGGRYINDMVTVTRDMSGIYTCQATNQRGNLSKEVHVTVQYGPMTPILTLSTHANITKGDPLNITCRSDGLPAPTYSWQIPDNAEVTYSPDNTSVYIHKAAQTHRGVYRCVARNMHGELSAMQEVTVESDINIGLIAGIVAAVVTLLVILGLCRYFAWKKGRKGFYKLLGWSYQPQSHKNGNIPSVSSEPTQETICINPLYQSQTA